MAHTGVRYKGIFITFEGPEGSGKSTHARLLFKFLRSKGLNCIFTKEPGGTVIGNRIRKLLLERKNIKMDALCELFLFEANRAQITEEVILPALKKGKIVICDRFSDATAAYQGFGAGLNIRFIKELNNIAGKAIEPDLTILLDIEPKEGLKRTLKNRKPDRMECRSISFHRRVRNGYLQLAKQQSRRIKVFRSGKSMRDVQKDVREVVLRCLSRI